MTKRHDQVEERVICMLEEIVFIDRRSRDALSGAAVKKVKEALRILRRRRRDGIIRRKQRN